MRDELLGGRVVAQPVLQQPQLERDRDEPLLGAVVEVALQPPALRVAGASTIRSRDARRSASRAADSACRCAFSSAIAAAAVTASSSSGSSSSEAS